MVQVHEGRGDKHRWRHFDREWRLFSHDAGSVGPPVSLTMMLAAAEKLAGEADFLRVDFYEVGGRPLFGEFCLYPGSGLDPLDPVELDHGWPSVGTRQARAVIQFNRGGGAIAEPDFATASIAAE